MNSLINNPGYYHITKKIFKLMDDQSLLACRLTCQSWKIQVEQPDYLIEKCKKKGQPKELHDSWIDLFQKIKKGSKIEQKVVQCLMKWSIQCHLWSHLQFNGFTLCHIAARYGCLEVVKFISTNAENEITKSLWKPDNRLPIHLASANGHTEVVKFFASKIENLHILDKYGNVPMLYAAANGHLETVKFIASKVENPNYITNYGMCPFKLACRNNHYDVIKFLYPYTPEYQTNLGVRRALMHRYIPFTFGLKCAWKEWKESKNTYKFLQSSTYISFFYLFLLKIQVLNYIILTEIFNSISISIQTLGSNICHVSKQYDDFHSLNVTHAFLTEITHDEKIDNRKITSVFYLLIYLFFSVSNQTLLTDCHCGKKKFRQFFVSLLYLYMISLLPLPLPNSIAVFLGLIPFLIYIFMEIMDLFLTSCPKHYMHQHM